MLGEVIKRGMELLEQLFFHLSLMTANFSRLNIPQYLDKNSLHFHYYPGFKVSNLVHAPLDHTLENFNFKMEIGTLFIIS